MSRPPIRTALLRSDAGVIAFEGVADHSITIHAEGRITSSFACDGVRAERELVPGVIDLIPAATPARLVDGGRNAVLLVAAPPDHVEARLDELGRRPGRLRPLAGLDDPMLVHLGWRLHRRRDQPRDLLDDCLADEFVGRLLWRHEPRVEAPEDRIGALNGARLRRVLDFIEARLDGPVRIGELAAEARLGPTSFKIAFRKAMGVPAHRYLVGRRAARARLMLLDGELPAAQIALEAGFSHQTHMARWLRRLFGTLPSELTARPVE